MNLIYFNSHQEMKTGFILAILYILITTTLQINNLSQLSTLSIEDLQENDLVVVTQSSQTIALDEVQRQYYNIRVIHKEKKQAYSNMKTLFQRVVRILIKNKVIPDQSTLVKSKIKPQYLSKKRSWAFSTIFAIYGSEKQIQVCTNQLLKMGIYRVGTKPTINFLNQKIIALQVFNSAKSKLLKELANFPGFEIKEVKQIQIKGAQLQNSDILQQQLQEQFNNSEQIIEEDDIIESQNESVQGSIQMKVIFRIGKQSEDNSYDEEVQEYSEEQEYNSEDSDDSL